MKQLIKKYNVIGLFYTRTNKPYIKISLQGVTRINNQKATHIIRANKNYHLRVILSLPEKSENILEDMFSHTANFLTEFTRKRKDEKIEYFRDEETKNILLSITEYEIEEEKDKNKNKNIVNELIRD